METLIIQRAYSPSRTIIPQQTIPNINKQFNTAELRTTEEKIGSQPRATSQH